MNKEEIINEMSEVLKPLKLMYPINVQVLRQNSPVVFIDFNNEIGLCVSAIKNYELIFFKNPFLLSQFLVKNNISDFDYECFKVKIVNFVKKLEQAETFEYFFGSVSLSPTAITSNEAISSILTVFENFNIKNPVTFQISTEGCYLLDIKFEEDMYLTLTKSGAKNLQGRGFASFLVFNNLKEQDFQNVWVNLVEKMKEIETKGIKVLPQGLIYTIDFNKDGLFV